MQAVVFRQLSRSLLRGLFSLAELVSPLGDDPDNQVTAP